MSGERDFLKRATLGRLGAVAEEHPAGHQDSKAARFLLASADGARVEVMVEKNDDSPLNIWCHVRAVDEALLASVPRSITSPASKLWTGNGKDGRPAYGRHSALRGMGQLADADLACLKPETAGQIGLIIDRLRRVRRSDLP